MLAFAEDYLRRIGNATTDGDIIAILGRLADDLGYRSAYLIEYANALKSAVLVLDSNSRRGDWWARFLASGLRTSTRPAAEMLARGGVQYFDATRFVGTRDHMLDFARHVDMIDATAVPINLDATVVGMVAFCGKARLSPEQERTLQFICYNLFSRARMLRISGVRIAHAALTPREREVMALSAEGLTAQQVGERLGVAPRTVHQHMDNVADKLGTGNRVHTVAEAIRRELLPARENVVSR
jgi:DNA-binding CsgD family transcriptional regulator